MGWSTNPVPNNRTDPETAQTVRLDDICHPYGPCPSALEALQHPPQVSRQALAARLGARLAERYRVPAESIHFLGDRLDTIKQLIGTSEGPLISFPPSGLASLLGQAWTHREPLRISRGVGLNAALTLERAMDLPGDGVAVLDSPSDPLGTVLSAAEAVRIARACRFLIIDERCAEFSGRSLLSLALEFENVAIVRTFELWAGLAEAKFAWTVTSPRSHLARKTVQDLPPIEAAAAAVATLNDLASVTATLKILRDERSRLYRELRKLSIFEPLPSWGPFLTARVAIGRREDVVMLLRSNGVAVYAPQQLGLEQYIRFGIGSRSEMERLRQALHEVATTILA